MIAAAPPPPVHAAATAATPSDAACMASIRRGDPGRVDKRCWRVGPLRLAMTRAQVEARLGVPDLETTLVDDLDGGRTYPTAVYVFPRDLAARLAANPLPAVRFQILELAFRDGHLVRIGNTAAVRTPGAACTAGRARSTPVALDPDAFRPYQRFLSVRVGDRLADVRRRLGPWSFVSNGGDFVNMFPTALTFDVDEDGPLLGRRVTGFALQADADAGLMGEMIDLTLERDPATCRVHGFGLTAGSGR